MGLLHSLLSTATVEIVVDKGIRKAGGNRTAGHNFERECVKLLRAIGFVHAVSSRSESKSRDDAKVDMMNKNELINGRLPYNISCKNMTALLKYSTLLAEMPKGKEINVIWHKFTKKKSGKFHEVGRYAILDMEDFLKMAQRIHELEKQVADKRLNGGY